MLFQGEAGDDCGWSAMNLRQHVLGHLEEVGEHTAVDRRLEFGEVARSSVLAERTQNLHQPQRHASGIADCAQF